MGRGTLAAILVFAATGVFAAPAAADPFHDYQSVRADWTADGVIVPCRWSEQQLENTRSVSTLVPEDQYTSFPADVDAEIQRWRSGRCSGRTPDDRHVESPLADLRIVRVVGRGKTAREYVRVRNSGRKAVSLRGATLRNRRGGRVKLPAWRIAPRRTITIRLACQRGKRRATRRGTRVWLCRKRATGVFADRGDVARLVDRRGVVVSQRGFGRYSRTESF